MFIGRPISTHWTRHATASAYPHALLRLGTWDRFVMAIACLIGMLGLHSPSAVCRRRAMRPRGHAGRLPGDRSRTVAGSTDAGNMAISSDGGHCWSAARLDAPVAHRMGDFVSDPVHPRVLIAASGSIGRVGVGSTDGLLRSGNNSHSWSRLGPGNGLPSVRFIATSLVATRSGLFIAVSCPDEVSLLSTRAIRRSSAAGRCIARPTADSRGARLAQARHARRKTRHRRHSRPACKR